MQFKMLSKFLISLSTLLLCFYGFFNFFPALAQGIDDFSSEAIIERIKPVGEPTIAGEEKKSSETQLATPAPPPTNVALTGEQIYTQYCSVCHAIGVAGAPKLKDKVAWDARGGKKAIDTLVKSAIQGKNAMPPKGNCTTCQDKDIYNAVLYMISE